MGEESLLQRLLILVGKGSRVEGSKCALVGGQPASEEVPRRRRHARHHVPIIISTVSTLYLTSLRLGSGLTGCSLIRRCFLGGEGATMTTSSSTKVGSV